MVSENLKEKMVRLFLKVQKFFPLPKGLILCYHSVDDDPCLLSIDTPTFEIQMNLLKSQGYQSVSLGQMVDHLEGRSPLPARSVCITFDDGYKSVLEKAFPILKRCGFGASVFLPTDFIGRTSEWLRENRNPEFDSLIPELPLMTWDEIRDLSKEGFLFESHTCSHPDLTKLSDREIEREFKESREIIREETGQKSEFLCYPYGFLNERVANLTWVHGYRGGCTLISGVNLPGQNPFFLRRCGIDIGCFDPMVYFGIYTSRLCRPVLELKRVMGW